MYSNNDIVAGCSGMEYDDRTLKPVILYRPIVEIDFQYKITYSIQQAPSPPPAARAQGARTILQLHPKGKQPPKPDFTWAIGGAIAKARPKLRGSLLRDASMLMAVQEQQAAEPADEAAAEQDMEVQLSSS